MSERSKNTVFQGSRGNKPLHYEKIKTASMSRQEEDQRIRVKRKEMKAKRAACLKGPTCDYCERTGLCIDETSMREETIKIYPGKSPGEIASTARSLPELPPSCNLRRIG